MQDNWHVAWEAIWGAKLMSHPRARQAYPTEDAAKLGMAMFASVLSDIEDVAVLKAAVAQCCATCEWLPTPAEIRAAAGALVAPRFPAQIDAWANAVAEIRAAKSEQRPPRYEHPLVARVIAGLGGEYAILRSELPAADRGQFLTAYRELVERESEQSRLIPQARELAGAQSPPLLSGESEIRVASGVLALALVRCRRCGAEGRVPGPVDMGSFVCPPCRQRSESVGA